PCAQGALANSGGSSCSLFCFSKNHIETESSKEQRDYLPTWSTVASPVLRAIDEGLEALKNSCVLDSDSASSPSSIARREPRTGYLAKDAQTQSQVSATLTLRARRVGSSASLLAVPCLDFQRT